MTCSTSLIAARPEAQAEHGRVAELPDDAEEADLTRLRVGEVVAAGLAALGVGPEAVAQGDGLAVLRVLDAARQRQAGRVVGRQGVQVAVHRADELFAGCAHSFASSWSRRCVGA